MLLVFTSFAKCISYSKSKWWHSFSFQMHLPWWVNYSSPRCLPTNSENVTPRIDRAIRGQIQPPSAYIGQCTMQHCCSGDRWPPMRLENDIGLATLLSILPVARCLFEQLLLLRPCFQKISRLHPVLEGSSRIVLCCFLFWCVVSTISTKGATFVVPRKMFIP